MATRQHRRNKRNRARSIAGQGKPQINMVTAWPHPDWSKLQERVNWLLHAINNLASIQTHTLGGSDD